MNQSNKRVPVPTVIEGLHNMAKIALNTIRTMVKYPPPVISMHVTNMKGRCARGLSLTCLKCRLLGVDAPNYRLCESSQLP